MILAMFQNRPYSCEYILDDYYLETWKHLDHVRRTSIIDLRTGEVVFSDVVFLTYNYLCELYYNMSDIYVLPYPKEDIYYQLEKEVC